MEHDIPMYVLTVVVLICCVALSVAIWQLPKKMRKSVDDIVTEVRNTYKLVQKAMEGDQ